MSAKNILLVVGNGITISLHKKYSIANQLNPSNPLSWEFKIDQVSSITWQDAFPILNSYIGKNIANLNNDFEIFRNIHSKEMDGKLEIESRHFLALAYAYYSINTCVPNSWEWVKFLKKHSPSLLSIISFNYDLIAEKALIKANQNIIYGEYKNGFIPVFKPHGSCNLESHPSFISMPDPQYPLNIWMNCNNVPQYYLTPENYMKPRKEGYCILPHENNKYIDFQWQTPFWNGTKEKADVIEHCIIIGLSYHPADRLEINRIIELLNSDTVIHLCNPSHHPDLIKFIEISGKKLKLHESIPQEI